MNVLVSKPVSEIKILDPRGGHNRYNCNFDFFKRWTNEMAYVLGFLYADGTIIDAVSSRTQYIIFASRDREILEKIRTVMNSEHPLCIQPPRIHRHKNGIYKSRELFILRIGSRKMFNDLIHLGVVPKKSKIAIFPEIPPRYLNHFVRGYFDGDGCVYLQKKKGKRQSVAFKRISVIFTSGSKIFLEGVVSALRNIGVNQDKIYNSNRAYQLRYSISDSVKLFKFLYKNASQKNYLERKFKIFLEYFQLCPARVDEGIKNILHFN